MKTISTVKAVKAIRIVRDAEVEWSRKNVKAVTSAEYAAGFIAGLQAMARQAIKTIQVEGSES